MQHETTTYKIDDQSFKGYWVFPKGENPQLQKRPAILIAHAWMGQDHFVKQKAEEIAQLGYIGFAADMYGDGKVATNEKEAGNLMAPLFKDRSLLQKRIKAAFDHMREHPGVDQNKMGAIGFCFGGLTVIELLRSGADIKGVVSFHGVLGDKLGDLQAKTVPIASSIKGSLLILHGFDDPLDSSEEIAKKQKEFNSAGIDWQMNIYGHTAHAFTNPEAHDKSKGLNYNPQSAMRAWWSMIHFFSERFGLARVYDL